MNSFPKNILLTGPKQIGKSTLVRKILAALPKELIGGFLTEPVLSELITYQIRDLSNDESQIFARQIHANLHKFKIDPAVFDSFGRKILVRALSSADLIVLDEIGVMEQSAFNFRQQIIACLDAPKPVLAVVKAKQNPFLDQLKARADCLVIELTQANRNKLEIPLTIRVKNILAASAN